MNAGSKYINQAVEKFRYFRIKSPVTRFEIFKNDFSDEIRKKLVQKVRNHVTKDEKYNKLDGIMVEVIARIYNETKPLILDNVEHEYHVSVMVAINEIRTAVSNHWELI